MTREWKPREKRKARPSVSRIEQPTEHQEFALRPDWSRLALLEREVGNRVVQRLLRLGMIQATPDPSQRPGARQGGADRVASRLAPTPGPEAQGITETAEKTGRLKVARLPDVTSDVEQSVMDWLSANEGLTLVLPDEALRGRVRDEVAPAQDLSDGDLQEVIVRWRIGRSLTPSLGALATMAAGVEQSILDWLDENRLQATLLTDEQLRGAIRAHVEGAQGIEEGALEAMIDRWREAEHIPSPVVTGRPPVGASLPSALPEWLSLYSAGMVGFHVSVPSVSGAPLEARLTAPFRARGLPVDSQLLTDLTTNYSAGIQELEQVLRAFLPSELHGQVPGLAAWLAEKLQAESLEATLRRERPTPIEREEQRGEVIEGILHPEAEETSTTLGALIDTIGEIPAGVSITIRF